MGKRQDQIPDDGFLIKKNIYMTLYSWYLDADLRIGRRLETGRPSESYTFNQIYGMFEETKVIHCLC
jgi:hypothetical protein